MTLVQRNYMPTLRSVMDVNYEVSRHKIQSLTHKHVQYLTAALPIINFNNADTILIKEKQEERQQTRQIEDEIKLGKSISMSYRVKKDLYSVHSRCLVERTHRIVFYK